MAVNIVKTLDTLDNIRKITRFDEATRTELLGAVADLKTHLQERETERNNLLATLNQNQATITNLSNDNANLKQDNAAKAAKIDELTRKLAAAAAPPSATAMNIASSFKGVVDRIQEQARQAGGVASTIKSMDIEVKGLVNVQQDGTAVLVLPTPSAPIDPSHLSTLRVSFGAVPGIASPAAPARAPTPATAASPGPAETGEAAPSAPTRGEPATPPPGQPPPSPRRTKGPT